MLRRLIFLVVVLAGTRTLADSWMSPEPVKAKSADKQYEARTTPAEKGKPAQLVVRRADGARVWEAQLSNPVAPTSVLISNDGRHVVTFDNWYQAGFGDDAVAFYRDGEQVKRYSLEQVFGVEKIELNHPAVSHSASSRMWRYDGIGFIEEIDGKNGRTSPNYVIWLARTDQWLAWDMSTGDKIATSDEQLTRWEKPARRRALAMLTPDDNEQVAMQFLAKLRRPEDRTRIEKWLLSTKFVHGSVAYRTEGAVESVELVSHSPDREAADKVLAAWDQRPWKEQGVELGGVHGTLQVPMERTSGRSVIHVYLVSESVDRGKWASAEIPNRISRRVSEMGSNVAGKRLEFRFRQVTPGRYRVNVVFDAAKPHGSEKRPYAGESGDYEGEVGDVVEVKQGETAEVGTVRCDQSCVAR